MFSEHVQSRAAKREATRRTVLASAEKLFREQGFGATTIRQIAADAQVSTGTVMAVGEKDALLVAIFDGWIGEVHSGRSAVAEGARSKAAPGEAVAEIMELIEPFISYFALDRELSREYAAIIVRGNLESEVFQHLALALIGEIHGVLSRTALSGLEADRGARAVYFAYLGILMTASSGAVEQEFALDQFRDVVRFVARDEGA